MDRQFESCVDLPRVFFFAIDDDGSGACFDTTARDGGGEMEVLEVGNYRELLRYRSLAEFLDDYRAMMESWVSDEPFTSVEAGAKAKARK